MSDDGGADGLPRRIVCLTEETTDVLYRLGEQDRIVGISGYTRHPPEARREKPVVAAFTTADVERVVALEPDLVLGFSDLQAELLAALVRRGLEVLVFNQRSIDGILRMVLRLGALVGASERAETLVRELRAGLQPDGRHADPGAPRPVVYFEEWGKPLISGIGWVSELIAVAGGVDCFPELAARPDARGRIVEDPQEVVRRAPDIIVGSWCGKPVDFDAVRGRPGWERIPAVRDGRLYEIPSADILAPGPAALTAGVEALREIVQEWREGRSDDR